MDYEKNKKPSKRSKFRSSLNHETKDKAIFKLQMAKPQVTKYKQDFFCTKIR